MKVKDVERVNVLLAELEDVKGLVGTAAQAEPSDCVLFLERPGVFSIKMSAEGTTALRYRGFVASAGFLDRLKTVALEELTARRQAIEAELSALGIEPD